MQKKEIQDQKPSARLIKEEVAAERLDVKPGTLKIWRCTKRYPLPYVKIGGAVRYRPEDIEAFIESRTQGGE